MLQGAIVLLFQFGKFCVMLQNRNRYKFVRQLDHLCDFAIALVMAGLVGGSQVSMMDQLANPSNNGQPNGGGSTGAVGSDPLTNHLAGMSKHQLYEIVSQMKDLIQQNQQQARQILVANPQLTKALFQAQVMLGMVRPPQVLPDIQQLPLQSVPTQPQSQGDVSQRQVQTLETTAVEAPSLQTMPMQPQPLQQGKMHMTQNQQPQVQGMLNPQPQISQIQPETHSQGSQHSQAQNVSTSQPSQGFIFQHPIQAFQQSHAQTTSLQPPAQNATPHSNAMQGQSLMQLSQSQTPPLHHPQPPGMLPQHLQPPLPHHPRLLAPTQVAQAAHSMNFQFPSFPQQQHLPQPSFQYQQQVPPPLPNQPLPQQSFQVARSGVDIGGISGLAQSGSGSIPTIGISIGLPGQQVGRGPGMGGHMPWNQPPPSGGMAGFMGLSHSSGALGMGGHMGPGHSVGGGIPTSLPGGLGAHLLQQDSKGYGGVRGILGGGMGGSTEGIGMPGMMPSQGYGQMMQPQQQPQMQLPFDVDQQKALLQQIMSLTPDQLNSLPPEQRHQIIQLQQAFQS